MEVYSILNGKYFKDKTICLFDGSRMYHGTYRLTPIYPLYTFSTNGRIDYINARTIIKFYSMVQVDRLFRKALVETSLTLELDEMRGVSLEVAIERFRSHCEELRKNIKLSSLV